eukprot:Skav206763  [mRNA]  locus=scaffold167:415286:420515:+ [translate_table: standard]
MSLRRLLMYLISLGLTLSIFRNLFEVNRHLWSREPPKDVSFWDQREIEGVYCRKEDSKFMARIQSNVLSWAPDFRSDPAELSVSGAKQALGISMSIGGRLYTAEVIPSRGELAWDDGEVWTKK